MSFGFINAMRDTTFPKADTWHFHKWTPWKQETNDYISYGPFWKPQAEGVTVTRRIQRRHCTICNKEQSEQLTI